MMAAHVAARHFEALAMIERGEIVDGKTIMLLLYAQWKGLI